jgi:hypothetical protein
MALVHLSPSDHFSVAYQLRLGLSGPRISLCDVGERDLMVTQLLGLLQAYRFVMAVHFVVGQPLRLFGL